MSDEYRQIGVGEEETPDRDGAFPRLDEDQLARFRQLGRLRTVEPGEVLFNAGDETTDFFVIESGTVLIVQGLGQENKVIAVQGHHRFLGELSLLVGQRLYLSGVVRDAGRVIQVPLDKLRQVVDEDKTLSDLILGAFMARRAILIDVGTGIKLIGSRFSPDSRRLRELLARNRMPYQWIDLDDDEDADALLSGLSIEPEETPVAITGGGEVLRNPSSAELGRAIGLGSSGPPPPLCDVVVVGAGPAGIAAALYAASEGLDVQGVDAVASGGQAGTSARIENYLGFPAGVSGSELTQRGTVQAAKFGAATQAEAQLCADDPVVIVGGGNSAGQAAMFLSRHAAHCRLLIRGGDLGKSMSRYLVDQIERNDSVEVMRHARVVELDGERELEGVTIADARALFVFIGASPHTEWLQGQLATDRAGFLLTGRDLQDPDLAEYNGEPPLFLETSRPGIFAVGDVHSGSVKRVASAVGEGSMAVRLVHQRLAAP